MNRSKFLTLAFAALAFASCGNKAENQTQGNDSLNIADTETVATLSSETQSTIDALIANFKSSVENNDANTLSTTLADMQVVYKNLVDNGKLEEAKSYGTSIQEFINEHTNEVKAMAEGNSTITSLVEGVKNLPTSAAATAEEAKQAIVNDVVNMASPAVAKGSTVVNAVKETADAVKNAPEAAKATAEQVAKTAVDNAKTAAQNKVDAAKTSAQAKVEAEKAKIEAEKAKAKASVANKATSVANKANSILDKAKAGINSAVQGTAN